jgi:DNA (cytosine-5)-methyltransferase 1
VFEEQRENHQGPTAAFQDYHPTFVDVFAGCGGLSLGLLRAGWRGLFAIEKDRFAFETFRRNLVDCDRPAKFEWPSWLPKDPQCINSLFETYGIELENLRGQIDLLAGGPPCQGFSSAGKRLATDPRNSLMTAYFRLVDILDPRVVLIENVHGITVDFRSHKGNCETVNYADNLVKELERNYHVYWRMINASEFGVPQGRVRFFLLGLRKDISNNAGDPFQILYDGKQKYLSTKNLKLPVSSSSAISDLEEARNGRVEANDSAGYEAIGYKKPKTIYQRLMRDGHKGQPSNTRLAKHCPKITKRFKEIIASCHANGRLNISIDKQMREKLGLKKLATRVLDPNRPSPTITSMPDDLIHYCEPRTLTVRENARLQSFPDWFDFFGKYTTGGHLRRKEVPRFTQVANAVPPLLAEAIGIAVRNWLSRHRPIHLRYSGVARSGLK